MADNTFRTTRRNVAAPSGQQFDDPLAELARLIGQNPPGQTPDRAAQQQHHETPPLDAPQSDPQWPADARYAEQRYDEQQGQYDDRQTQYGEAQYNEAQYNDAQYGEGQYSDSQYNDGRYGEGQYREGQSRESQSRESYDAPRLTDPAPAYRTAAPSYNNADDERSDRYAAPPQRHDTRGYSDQPHYYDDAHDPIQELPSFLPRARDDRHGYAQERGQERGHQRAPARGQGHAQGYGQNYGQDYDQEQEYGQDDYEQGYGQEYDRAQEGDPDDQGYALDDYEDEAPAPKRRGVAVAAALLGVAVLGTAGWFGYGAVFGGSGFPSLPPIIRADNTPNKIIPASSSTNASGQASADSGAPDKLVSREEKPVDVPAPANAPRVVSTIPVFPDPNAGLQSSAMPGTPSMAGQNMAGAAPSGPMSLGPTAAGSVYGGAATMPAAAPMAMASQNPPPLQSPPVAGAGNAKKIHTVAIHNGPDNSDADSAAPARAQAARPAPARSVAAAPQGGNGPLSIAPPQGGAAASAAPQTRTALARPQAAEAAPAAGSGYFVQVSSQRSEADAQSAYHSLQAKYPSQLGGHEPTIRQVDLGEKGTFFRALVGPYGSMEQAAQMCSNLKSAGGSCLVQRN
ncbi:MAG TPA: SPOR domain-containing protein [Xanthobacteraceae bacterium]|nr:SPOR domain-containing protein [Xanthobacteraceae bacterium]